MGRRKAKTPADVQPSFGEIEFAKRVAVLLHEAANKQLAYLRQYAWEPNRAVVPDGVPRAKPVSSRLEYVVRYLLGPGPEGYAWLRSLTDERATRGSELVEALCPLRHPIDCDDILVCLEEAGWIRRCVLEPSHSQVSFAAFTLGGLRNPNTVAKQATWWSWIAALDIDAELTKTLGEC